MCNLLFITPDTDGSPGRTVFGFGPTVIAALANLEFALHRSLGIADALSGQPCLPDLVRSIQNGDEYTYDDPGDPEGRFTVAPISDAEAACYRIRKCSRLWCNLPAAGIVSGGTAEPFPCCEGHGKQAQANGWTFVRTSADDPPAQTLQASEALLELECGCQVRRTPGGSLKFSQCQRHTPTPKR